MPKKSTVNRNKNVHSKRINDVVEESRQENNSDPNSSYEVTLNRVMAIVFPRREGTEVKFRTIDVFDSTWKIGTYKLHMLVSVEQKLEESSIQCLYKHHDPGNEQLFNLLLSPVVQNGIKTYKIKPKFEKFLNEVINDFPDYNPASENRGAFYYQFQEVVISDGILSSDEEGDDKKEKKCVKAYSICVYKVPFNNIGRRNYGPLYLVLVSTEPPVIRLNDITANQEKHPLQHATILYRILAEINSNIWIKRELEEKPTHVERVREVKKPGTRESYHRAVRKMAALQRYENFGRMIDTLVDIDFHSGYQEKPFITQQSFWMPPKEEGINIEKWKEEVKDWIEKEFDNIDDRIKDYYLARYEFTDQNGKTNLFDTVELQGDAIEQRKNLIRLMWKSSWLLYQVRDISRDPDFGSNSSETESPIRREERSFCDRRIISQYGLSIIGQEAEKLLHEVPKFIWEHNRDILAVPDNPGDPNNKRPELKLDSYALAMFLLSKISEWKNVSPTDYDSEKKDFNTIVVYLTHLLQIIQFVLRIRKEDDADVMRAMICMISEYGHDHLKIDRRLDLEKHLFLQARQQSALFGLKDYYRDHLNHVIQVCLTGWLLLDTKSSDPVLSESLHESITQKLPPSCGGVLAQWFVSSLLHDVGYVLTIGQAWGDLINSFETQTLEEIYGDLKKFWSDKVQKKLCKHSSITDLVSEVDHHGVISAVHTKEYLDSISNSLSETFEPAINAIALHGSPKKDVSFQTNPLGVLLILCDEIQQWGRPGVDRDKLSLALSLHSPKNFDGWNSSIKSVSVNIATKFDKNFIFACNAPLTCTIKYDKSIHKNNSLFHVWIARSQLLQNLDLTQFPFDDVVFDLWSPLKENKRHSQHSNELEFEKLKRFVRGKGYSKKLSWHDCVENAMDKINNESFEHTRIITKMLNKHKPVKCSFSTFLKDFIAWNNSDES